MRELDHRAKNLLAVVQAALRLTPKDNIADFVKAVEGRVGALARTHTLLAEGRWEGAGLRQLILAALAPFRSAEQSGEGAPTPRADLRGPEVTLAPPAAQAVSMALHEFATNATKYGALSAPAGRVSVSWDIDAEAGWLRLRWMETGGPEVDGSPDRRGFGSRVIEATLREQLGGSVERRWEPAGIVCDIVLPLARVLADRPDGAGTPRNSGG
jgi:two-component sensor histidine kinase